MLSMKKGLSSQTVSRTVKMRQSWASSLSLLGCPVTTAAPLVSSRGAFAAPHRGATVDRGLQVVPLTRGAAFSAHPRAWRTLF